MKVWLLGSWWDGNVKPGRPQRLGSMVLPPSYMAPRLRSHHRWQASELGVVGVRAG